MTKNNSGKIENAKLEHEKLETHYMINKIRNLPY
jgi:hypothetical protein